MNNTHGVPPIVQWYQDEFGKEPSKHWSPQHTEVIAEASQDPFLGSFVLRKQPAEFRWFVRKDQTGHHDILTGFAIPRRDSDGRYRTGAIYVRPEYRKQGIAAKFVKEYFANKKGRAFIEDHNHASIALFTGIGFRKSGKTVTDAGDLLYEYLKD